MSIIMVSSVLGQAGFASTKGSLERSILAVVENGIWTLPMVVARGTIAQRRAESPIMA
jgi:hypothetical protein